MSTIRRSGLIWLIRLVPLLLAGSLGSTLACSSSTEPGGCCKTCTTGKACGDTCIAASATCHVSGGCACNGAAPL